MLYKKIDREILDKCFNDLSKIYKKKSKGFEIEIILIGGASILLNYNFRDVTSDVDAIYLETAELKEAIKEVSEKYGLNFDWLNGDVKKTISFSKKLAEFSVFYKTYNNVITVRTIKDEYLIAMKLKSGRIYKNDMSDIVGILSENVNNKKITYDMVDKAMKDLYDGWDGVDKNVIDTFNKMVLSDDLKVLYNEIISEEKTNRDMLLDFDEKYPNVLKESNIKDILKKLDSKS